MKTFLATCLTAVALLHSTVSQSIEYKYEISPVAWEETYGNHRAVLQVDKTCHAAELRFRWRRHDRDVEDRRFVVVSAASGDTVANVRRIEVTPELCHIQFGPVTEPGEYHFYYLPYPKGPDRVWYNVGYFPPEAAPDQRWLSELECSGGAVEARVMRVESRTEFDSFYPMELAATTQEARDYCGRYGSGVQLFPEGRDFPIKMRDAIPARWLDFPQVKPFEGEASPNEYYAFQVGVWAADRSVEALGYKMSDLRSDNGSIPANAVTCFNVEGIDARGVPFTKVVDVPQGHVQPLWFGVDIPADAPEGVYRGSLSISAGGNEIGVVPISLKISGQAIADRGDSDPWRHSRLRWLNSTLGLEDKPVKPYTPVERNGNRIDILGRSIIMDPATAMPAKIAAWGIDVLKSPMRFVIETSTGVKRLKGAMAWTETTGGHASLVWNAEDEDLVARAESTVEFDGWSDYKLTVTPKKDIEVADIRLEMELTPDASRFFMGAGLPGCSTPEVYDAGWEGNEEALQYKGRTLKMTYNPSWRWPFDSFWTGSASAGLHVELRGASYTGPMLNLYQPEFPESWHNGGKGGFKVRKSAKSTNVTVYSGSRTLAKETPMTFEFAILTTPVKSLDLKSHFATRYFHRPRVPRPTDEELASGANVINVHHGNDVNPFINYPFLTVDKMREFVDFYHAKGCKVKFYYTTRELATALPELWALRSLGDEILFDGGEMVTDADGEGYPWCREHLVSGYKPHWFCRLTEPADRGIIADASVMTSVGETRWYNYYVEGLRWLAANVGMDGIYLDDVSYGREILKRMRRALELDGRDCMIDLHSNTGGSRGPAIQYAEFFPYVDRLWFGEAFVYDSMSPENWLVESSGIPFGLTGDMLQSGGNKWLGMQFGMTNRFPWVTSDVFCDPRPLWRVWDNFGIGDAQMFGFWEKNPAVTASDPDVKVTAWRNGSRIMLSLGNYSDEARSVTLHFDRRLIKTTGRKLVMKAPEIEDFQPAAEWSISDRITIEPHRGWIIFIEQ